METSKPRIKFPQRKPQTSKPLTHWIGAKCQIDGDSEDTPSRRRGHGRGAPPSADAFHRRHSAVSVAAFQARYVPCPGVRVSFWWLEACWNEACGCGGCDACVILVQAPCEKRKGLRLVLGSWWIDRSLDDDDDDVVVVVVVGKEGMLTDRRANRWLVGCGMMMNMRTHKKKRKKKRTHKDG